MEKHKALQIPYENTGKLLQNQNAGNFVVTMAQYPEVREKINKSDSNEKYLNKSQHHE